MLVAVPSAEDLISATLRGEHAPWTLRGPEQAEQFFGTARMHGVMALLHSRLRAGEWPAEVMQQLRSAAIQQAMWELRHQQLVSQALAALAANSIQPILIKGTALAYSLYPDAALRSRGDTDLVIDEAHKQCTHVLLQSLGFRRHSAVSGETVSYQATYTYSTPEGNKHSLDLHWKTSNSEVLAKLFTYDELKHSARPLSRLSPHGLEACPVHALLIACVHRSTHKQQPYTVQSVAHHNANRVIWLYDIHLLAGRLDPQEWGRFTQLAQDKGLRAVCLDGMRQAQEHFHTAYPPDVIESLARPGPTELPAVYLESNALRQQWMDFVALGNASRRVRYLLETLFPAADYMHGKFPGSPRWVLPWLYLRRTAGGAAQRLARVLRT